MAYTTDNWSKGSANSGSSSSRSGYDWSSLFGSSSGSGTSNSDWLGLAMMGVGSALESRDAKKMKKKDYEFQREMVRMQGDESRKNLYYGALLEENNRQRQRYEKSQGLGNWAAYAKTQGPSKYATLNNMMSFTSPNQIKDPGATPNPTAFYETRQGAARDMEGSQVPYAIGPNGQPVPLIDLYRQQQQGGGG